MIDSFDSDTYVDGSNNDNRSAEGYWRNSWEVSLDPESSGDDQPTMRMQRTWLVGGRYELQHEISSGGMGRVFSATHRDLGRQFALKLLLEGQRQKPESRERFFVEARLASSLAHPNIVSVTDYGIDDEHGCYLVMELLEGSTVGERLESGGLAPRLAFDIVDQLTGAVRFMHARGILHGDIKPANVFLAKQEGEPRRKNVVKLLDFGLSFKESSAPEAKLGGTPPYLAPERLRGAPQSPACDVYSLGILLYEMLTGRLPYRGTLTEVITHSLGGPMPPAPSKLVPGLDASIDALVMRAIDREPARRHPTTEAFHFEVRTVMSMAGLKVRKLRAVSSSPPDAWAAIESALVAARSGDFDRVLAILKAARGNIDTFTQLQVLPELESLCDDEYIEDV
ncbi:MAG: serine/threonine-protein kinase [Polyangia bacterium]